LAKHYKKQKYLKISLRRICQANLETQKLHFSLTNLCQAKHGLKLGLKLLVGSTQTPRTGFFNTSLVQIGYKSKWPNLPFSFKEQKPKSINKETRKPFILKINLIFVCNASVILFLYQTKSIKLLYANKLPVLVVVCTFCSNFNKTKKGYTSLHRFWVSSTLLLLELLAWLRRTTSAGSGVVERDLMVTAWGAQPLLARLMRGS